eukprot:Pgem_evm2s9947
MTFDFKSLQIIKKPKNKVSSCIARVCFACETFIMNFILPRLTNLGINVFLWVHDGYYCSSKDAEKIDVNYINGELKNHFGSEIRLDFKRGLETNNLLELADAMTKKNPLKNEIIEPGINYFDDFHVGNFYSRLMNKPHFTDEEDLKLYIKNNINRVIVCIANTTPIYLCKNRKGFLEHVKDIKQIKVECCYFENSELKTIKLGELISIYSTAFFFNKIFSGMDFLPLPPDIQPHHYNNRPDVDIFNTWTGWNYLLLPKNKIDFNGKGVEDLLSLYRNCLENDDECVSYFLSWQNHILTNPSEKTGVAPSIIGPQGAGKSCLGEAFGALFRDASAQFSGLEPVIGTFNSEMFHNVFFLVDELPQASRSKDAVTVEKFKSAVTEKKALRRNMFEDYYKDKQYLNFMLTLNNHACVLLDTAKSGNRRFPHFNTTNEYPDKRILARIKNWLQTPDSQESKDVFQNWMSILFHLHNLEYDNILSFFKPYNDKWSTRYSLESFPTTQALIDSQMIKAHMPIKFMHALKQGEIVGIPVEKTIMDRNIRYEKILLATTPLEFNTWPVNEKEFEIDLDDDGNPTLLPGLWLNIDEMMNCFRYWADQQGYSLDKIKKMDKIKFHDSIRNMIKYNKKKKKYDIKSISLTGYADEMYVFMDYYLRKGYFLEKNKRFTFDFLYSQYNSYVSYKKFKDKNPERIMSKDKFSKSITYWFSMVRSKEGRKYFLH